MKKFIAAAVLAGFALAASAQDHTLASTPEACPAGTAAATPSYKWQDGRFVRDGWVCESIYTDG